MTQLRRGVLEHAVLALLEREERYGYDLVSELSEAGLVASEGTVYPLLTRLRKDDLVTTVWRESDSGPARRYYRISTAGETSLTEFRSAWSQFSATVDAVLDGSRQKDRS